MVFFFIIKRIDVSKRIFRHSSYSVHALSIYYVVSFTRVFIIHCLLLVVVGNGNNACNTFGKDGIGIEPRVFARDSITHKMVQCC